MNRIIVFLTVAALAALAVPAMAADAQPPLATVESMAGEVKVAPVNSEAWTPVKPTAALAENQIIKTGPQSQVSVRFTEGDLLTVVGENTTVALPDLLLKARLEKMRGKVNQPTDANQTKMQVTPLTGVRGTDAADSKAEEQKRPHTWEENDQPK
jgi:hypothetical protein